MAHWRKQMITIYPTNQCNLRCTYCIASSGVEQARPQRINPKFARRGITDYFASNPHGLRFYSSGEPTQAMDIIRECIEYARDLAPNDLEVELQTNGCLDVEDALWLADNVDNIWVSIDAL